MLCKINIGYRLYRIKYSRKQSQLLPRGSLNNAGSVLFTKLRRIDLSFLRVGVFLKAY